jgi:2-oxoglutarate dehydrogenase E1 component
LYSKTLVDEGVLSVEEYKAMVSDYRAALDNGQHVAKSLVTEPNKELFVDWTPYINQPVVDEFDSSLPVDYIQELAHRMNKIPEGFAVQRQVQKIYDDREKMAGGGLALNWGMAETLAYASILDKGQPIRFTGQDVGRGTFSHRHAVLHDQKDESLYTPLKNLSPDQGALTIHDSYLSEEAVLAFEYGYATTMPSALVIWEAQFGDFANGAQVVIDQFITSGENKWGRLCGLTMLLPHGYEGQGPEHSSARLERYLQLCAEHNIQVCMPTTPAQIYHLLRRQAVRNLRKPLIVMTPKSLLRHKDAISSIDDLASGTFNTVIPEVNTSVNNDKVTRAILCSGRVYYDLVAKRTELEKENLAIIRIEQLYPFPEDVLEETLKQYSNLQDVVWCQEEPMNQGAWYCSQHHMRRVVSRINPDIYLSYTGREASASVAAGYMALHLEQLESFLNDALTYPKQ